jgi:LuxR family maltose regulon positive regulatory protein
MRLEDGLHEVRTEHLRLSLDDAATMLRAAGLDLTADQVARLHERTDGWAAGLRLAAIALRRTGDVEGFIADFSGDERSMADYLTGELLAGFSPETLDFLRSVSVCDRLPADLAVAVSGRQDAARLLDDLGRETALVERRPSGTYRLHPLLRTYLVANLQRHRPARHQRLHGVVARWWTAEAEPEHALLHAEKSGDETLLAESLRRTGVTLLLRGESAAVRHALAVLRHGGRPADPWLTLVAALVHIDERALPAAATALRQARNAWPSEPGPDLCALRLSTELLGAAVGLTINDPFVAATDRTPAGAELDALLRASRTVAGLTDDRWDAASAQSDLEACVAVARSHGFTFLEVQALCTLALVHAGRFDLPAMIDASRDAVRIASRHGRHPSAWTARASAVHAYSDLLAGEPAAARRWTENALEGGPLALPPETRYALRAIHGAAVADEGDRVAGLAEMRAARNELSGVLWPAAVPAALALLEHRGALLHGNLPAAREVLAWLERRTGPVGEVLLLEAWAELAAGRYDAARATLGPLVTGAVRAVLPHTCIEADLVEAEVGLHAGDVPAGTAALDRALRAAAEWGVVRPFVLAGPRTRALLADRPAERGTGGFSARLAAAREAVRADAAAPLSERELVVLALLPSLMSAGEIAAELTISVNTVKSHIRSIYAKLGASTRREAVRRAHEHGLLS